MLYTFHCDKWFCVFFLGQKTLGIHPEVIYSKNYYLFIRKCAQLRMTQKNSIPGILLLLSKCYKNTMKAKHGAKIYGTHTVFNSGEWRLLSV